MQRFIFQISLVLALIFAGICLTSTAFAGKSDHAGGKKGKNNKQEEKREKYKDNKTYDGEKGHRDNKREYFNEERQIHIHRYYSDQFRKGHCPPGLVQKGKHCIPRGHAKNWSKGRPLPREVIFYNLPPTILVQLGPPPPMHRFVRVAQDILLIAVGTGMVVDAFEDIGRQLD